MLGRLAEIMENKRHEIESRKAETSLALLKANVSPASGAFVRAMAGGSLKLITEIKPKSPSAGILQAELCLQSVLLSYNRFASAISVLTDTKYFGGSLALLSEVSTLSPKPLLCKDFILDEYQCFEARQAGAEAVLLIAKILEQNQLEHLYETILSLNMVPVLEVQTESELKQVGGFSAPFILINNRNLTTFDTDLSTTERLAPLVPQGCSIISASGIESSADIRYLWQFTNIFLIGSSLMKASNLDDKLMELSNACSTDNVDSAIYS